jgi:hypothetical protein
MSGSFVLVRMLVRLALALVVIMAALLLLISARDYDSSRVTRFFAASCRSMPCWQGIHPGTTTTSEAVAVLRALPWVEEISPVYASPNANRNGTVLIYWNWSRSYPYANPRNSDQQGIIVTEQGIVRQIYLTTGIALGDLWLTLGSAEGGVINPLDDQQENLRVEETWFFVRDGLAATASRFADCSTMLANYWHTPVYLWLRTNMPPPDETPVSAQFQQVHASLC